MSRSLLPPIRQVSAQSGRVALEACEVGPAQYAALCCGAMRGGGVFGCSFTAGVALQAPCCFAPAGGTCDESCAFSQAFGRLVGVPHRP